MAIIKRRDRIVLFRLAQDEYEGLRAACAERGGASISSFARSEVLRALGKVGYRNILLDASSKTVRLAKEGVELDPGGIGKGYAVDRMVDVLRRDGIAVALVSASGSSIYALGAPPGESGWKIRIRDPKDETKTVTEVTLKNESMSTSGNYEKFFWAAGRRYSHIMDHGPDSRRRARRPFRCSRRAPSIARHGPSRFL